MAVDGDFANFRASYDFLTDEVLRSSGHFLPEHLGNWFRTLDNTSTIAPIIQRLQNGLDFAKWQKEQQGSATGMGGTLNWPTEPNKRLGMKLLLFRSAAEANRDVISWFGHVYIPSDDRSVSNAAARFVEQVFGPMARELRLYLEQETQRIPASDRTIRLDHNSRPYREAAEALEKLEKALQEANDYPDAEEKDQRIAEVSATQRLLRSVRVRVAAVIAVIAPGLAYLASHFVGTAIDTAAHGVIEKLTMLLGAYF